MRWNTVHEFLKDSTKFLPHFKSFSNITLDLGTMTNLVCKHRKALRLISVWIRRTHHVLPQRWQVIHFTEVGLCLLNRMHAGVDGPHQGLLS